MNRKWEAVLRGAARAFDLFGTSYSKPPRRPRRLPEATYWSELRGRDEYGHWVTKSGREMTDEEIDAWVKESEKGDE